MEPSALLHNQKVFRLDADVEGVAFTPRLAQHPLEVDPRAEGMGHVVNVQVAGKAGDTLGPRQGGVSVQVDTGQHVVGVGPLTHTPHRRPCEPRTGVEDVVQTVGWHHLHLGAALHVDELRE